MPFERPTLSTLIHRAQTALEARLQTVDATLRRHLGNILARMEAGLIHGLYGMLSWLALQLMPDTAEEEHLLRWASIWGVRRKEATRARGNVEVTGAPGDVIPAGTLYQRADGLQYPVDDGATIPASRVAVVSVTAAETGSACNALGPARVQLASPLVGTQIQAQATVPAGFSGGTEVEDIESLRARLIARIQRPPRGGNKNDYRTWALEVAGFTRAWVAGKEQGEGTVTVRAVMDDSYPDGIPQVADIARLQNHLDEVRPVTADVFAVAPIPAPLDFRLVVAPDTPAVRAKVAASLAALIRREAEPGNTIFVSHVREAISVAVGEVDHVLFEPAGDVAQPTPGHMTVMGTITWVDG